MKQWLPTIRIKEPQPLAIDQFKKVCRPDRPKR